MLLYGIKGSVTVKYKNRYGRQRQFSTTYEGVIPFLQRRHQSSRERLEPRADRDATCARCRARRATARG